jgi:Zn ribbon nucleic-acid-binding protein
MKRFEHSQKIEKPKCNHPATFTFQPLPRSEVVACLKCGYTQIKIDGNVVHEDYYAAPIFVGFSNEIFRIIKDYFGDSDCDI